jgi:aryl-alcohol dehydrogenase-like predicted oxidoreductase
MGKIRGYGVSIDTLEELELVLSNSIRARWSQDVILKRAMIVDKIKAIVKDEGLVKYAIGFILSFDAVTTVITGVKNIQQLETNIKASEFKLSDE